MSDSALFQSLGILRSSTFMLHYTGSCAQVGNQEATTSASPLVIQESKSSHCRLICHTIHSLYLTEHLLSLGHTGATLCFFRWLRGPWFTSKLKSFIVVSTVLLGLGVLLFCSCRLMWVPLGREEGEKIRGGKGGRGRESRTKSKTCYMSIPWAFAAAAWVGCGKVAGVFVAPLFGWLSQLTITF